MFLQNAPKFKIAKKNRRENWKTSFIDCVLDPDRQAIWLRRMHQLPLNVFRKSALCPASQTLLDYRRVHQAMGEAALVQAHLDECEFCCAEMQLLDRYRYGPETSVIGEIPAALRRLAEMILSNSSMRLNGRVELAETQISN
jgi:hypothetical protein